MGTQDRSIYMNQLNKLTIVMYHYIRDLKNSRYPGIKGLELSDFIEQIAYLKKHYNCVTMEDVLSSFESGDALPPKAMLLTFDDAYAEHFNIAYPILKKNGIQGSFFPPAKVITEHVVLDVNKIHFILASTRDTNLLVADIQLLLKKFKDEYKLDSFDEYYAKLAIANRFDNAQVIFIKRLLQHELHEGLRNKIVNELFLKYVKMEEKAFSQELYMSTDQISHLVNDGMHIGSHGYEHYWWNKLPLNKLEQEIDLSIKFLEKVGVDISRWTACYPYGSSSYDVVEVLKKKKCQLALTTVVDVANLDTSDRLLIPRLDTNDLPKKANALTDKWYEKA